MGECRWSLQALSERVVWDWLDRWRGGLTGGNNGSEKKMKKKKRERERDNTPNNRCVLGSDPARDKCCDVIWDGGGQGAQPGLAVVDVTWYEARKTHRGGWVGCGVRVGGGSLSSFSLSLFLTHARTQTSAVCLIHCCLPRSVNLICPTMLPPTFPRSLILSCPFSIPLSLIFFLAPALSRFPPSGLVSLSRSAEQRAWVRLQTSLQWIDKNRALVTAAGWREGKERVEMKIRESKRLGGGEKGGWNTRRNENRRVKRKLERVGQKGGGRARWPRGVLGAARRGVWRMWTICEWTVCHTASIWGESTRTVACC